MKGRKELVFLEPNKNDFCEIPYNMKHLYIFENSNGLVKIGVSREFDRRRRTISSHGGFDITRTVVTAPISNYLELERLAHNYFSSSRVSGEWFNCKFEEAVEWIKSVIQDIARFDVKESHPCAKEFSRKLYSLPTAMEEEKNLNPIIYEYLVENGFEEYYDESGEIRVRGKDVDVSFETFAQLTIALLKME